MNLESYLRQHVEINQELDQIKQLIAMGGIEEHVRDIVLHINTLAGKLNMHLSIEDKYLYPSLKQNNEIRVQQMTMAYMDEMASLYGAFNAYKIKYNTPGKLKEMKSAFIQETKMIIEKIQARIEKEETELYMFI